jgi:hypothetical protein
MQVASLLARRASYRAGAARACVESRPDAEGPHGNEEGPVAANRSTWPGGVSARGVRIDYPLKVSLSLPIFSATLWPERT